MIWKRIKLRNLHQNITIPVCHLCTGTFYVYSVRSSLPSFNMVKTLVHTLLLPKIKELWSIWSFRGSIDYNFIRFLLPYFTSSILYSFYFLCIAAASGRKHHLLAAVNTGGIERYKRQLAQRTEGRLRPIMSLAFEHRGSFHQISQREKKRHKGHRPQKTPMKRRQNRRQKKVLF